MKTYWPVEILLRVEGGGLFFHWEIRDGALLLSVLISSVWHEGGAVAPPV